MSGIATDPCTQVDTFIRREKIFAILRGVATDHVVETARALSSGGIRLLEVTFDHSADTGIEDTLECISLIRNTLSDEVIVGAGTVLSPEQVRLAAQAGARFIVSPNLDHEVIRQTKDLGLFSMPGALTPTEITQAVKAGADMVKLFPGGSFGPAYVKAIGAPLKGIALVVVGGVDVDNIDEFFRAGATGVGLGSNLVSAKEANAGNYNVIERKARDYIERLRTVAI